MKLKNRTALWAIMILLLPMCASSATLQDLAAKFGNDLKNTDAKIAVMDFTGGETGENQDSLVVRERITTFLAQNKNITLIERALLEKVFQEEKLQMSGAVGVDTAKKIGELTGATIIVSGTLTDLSNDEVELNARAIEVGTGKVVSAGQAVFKRDWKYIKPLALGKDEKVVENSAQDYYQRGVKYHIHAKYNMALESYSKAIQLKPDYPEAYFGRGSIYAYPAGLVEGDNAKAIEDFSKAIDLKMDYAEAYFSRAMTYRAMAEGADSSDPKLKSADYGKAIADLNRVIELTPVSTTTAIDCEIGFIPNSPDYIGNYVQRGDIYLAKGEPDKALVDDNVAISLLPKCAYFYVLRGNAYRLTGDYPKAISDYSKNIELSSSSMSGYIGRGEAYYAKGDYDSSIADYTKAIELGIAQKGTDTITGWLGLDPNVYINRGNAYYMKADYDNAFADYNKAIELVPQNAEGYFYRANAYYQKGETDKALSDYSKAIELSPAYSSAYLKRAIIYSDKNEVEMALADYNKTIELSPQNSFAILNRGYIYQNKGKYAEAIADYAEVQVIGTVPERASAYINHGSIEALHGEYEKAVADFGKAIEIDPKDADAYSGRCNAYLKSRDYSLPVVQSQAIADCNKALELNPEDGHAFDNRIIAYQLQGDYDKVIANCTVAIKKKRINPKHNPFLYYQSRAQAYLSKGEYDKAIKDFESASQYLDKSDPYNMAVFYSARGEAYAHKKEYAKAIKDCTKAIELVPGASAAYRCRAESYYAIGEYKKSSYDVGRALELFPGLKGKMQTLIDSLRSAGY